MAVQNSPFEIRLGNNNEFKLGRKIGSGAFGDTYIGTNIHTGKEGRVYYVFNLQNRKGSFATQTQSKVGVRRVATRHQLGKPLLQRHHQWPQQEVWDLPRLVVLLSLPLFRLR